LLIGRERGEVGYCTSRRVRSLGVGLVVVLAIGAGGCSSSHGRVIVTTAEPTVESSPTPVASETPTPTPTPTAPASTPAPASACSGNATNQDFYAQAAAKYGFDVYCPTTLSLASWRIHTGTLDRNDMVVVYYGPGAAVLTLSEGAFCSGGACQPCDTDEGAAIFGNLTGRACKVGSGYAIYVDPGTSHAYRLQVTALALDAFKAIAAGFVRLR
jgi:hypothetical protein